MNAPADAPATTTLNDAVFGALFQFGADALFTISTDSRRIVSANRSLSELLGWANDALEGRPAADIFIGDERVDNWVDAIAERAGLYEEVALRRLDEYPVYVALMVAHIDIAGSGKLIACIARDTTDRRNLERQLISKHSALYAAHSELAVAFDELRATQERLEQRNQELSIIGAQLANAAHRAAIGEFSAGVAHSMNNPLGAATSALRQISMRLDTCEDQQLQTSLERFVKRATHALGRMEKIVDTTRRAHRSGNIAAAAKRTVIADAIAITMALFEGGLRDVEIVYSITPSWTGWLPPDALHHVLANLVENALTILDGHGRLRIATTEREAFVVLSVEDTAGGVPEDIRHCLFEPFVTRRDGGSGLGLSMSRRLARSWGGDITYTHLGNGSRFEVLIPKEEQNDTTPNTDRRRR